MPARIEIKTGKRFGRLIVIGEAPHIGVHRALTCRCDCGTVSQVKVGLLRQGKTRSCGCWGKEYHKTHGFTSHGVTDERKGTYISWYSMKHRTTANVSIETRKHYHDRGIKVCARWNKFEAFLSDMGLRPDGMSIDRIDNDKGYYPANCRWATMATQRRNTRRNRMLNVLGEIKNLVDWACDKRSAACESTIWSRLYRGWSDTDAVLTPVKKIRARTAMWLLMAMVNIGLYAQEVPDSILRALVRVESGCDWRGIGDVRGHWSRGADNEVSPFQLSPAALSDMGVTNSARVHRDVVYAESLARLWLSRCYEKHGNWADGLAAYNSGSRYRSRKARDYSARIIALSTIN